MRLIDANALRATDFELVLCGGDYKELCQLLIAKVECAPTVDAVPIVRCKDCQHSQHDEVFNDCWCDGRMVNPYHFCGYGKRRKGCDT